MDNSAQMNRSLWITLLLSYISVAILFFGQLPAWVFITALLVLVWRINIVREIVRPPGILIKIILFFSSLLLIAIAYGFQFSLEPMLALLVISLGLKILEVRHRRDLLVIVFLSYFAVACSFLFNQSVIHSLLGFLSVIVITTSLHHIFCSTKSLLKLFTLSSRMLLQSVALMFIMLLVIPRISPLWSVPLKSSTAVVGVSDSMSPGDFDQLIRSDELAFRVTFISGEISRENMYWRGLVFDAFDGRRWQPSISVNSNFNRTLNRKSSVSSSDKNISYEVLLEPTANRWLYGIPQFTIEQTAAEVNYSNQGEVFQTQPIYQRIKYLASTSFRNNTQVDELSPAEYLQYTQLPNDFNPATQQQAMVWRQQAGNNRDYMQKVLAYFRNNFTYTLSPPKLGKHTADEFLFESQMGFCEHFSSSFAILMRSVGIPARVVVGYQGGEWDDTSNYWRVYQRYAHAWNEVWLEGEGWIRVDPTAAAASVRIQQGISAALPAADRSQLSFNHYQLSLLTSLYQQWQRWDYQWQSWVLSYDSSYQKIFLQDIFGKITTYKLLFIVLIPLIVVGLLIGLSLFWDIFKPMDKNKRLYLLLRKKLSQLGVRAEAGESVRSLCKRAAKNHPTLAEQLNVIREEFERRFYELNLRQGADDKTLKKNILDLSLE